MRRKRTLRGIAVVVAAIALVLPVAAYGRDGDGDSGSQNESLVALTTAFTFQGRLTDGGSPANGTYDLQFFLYDAAAGGNQVGPVQVTGDVAVSAGLFTVSLDFGNVFHGNLYYLEIQVRPGSSSGTYTILSPREPIMAVPNATFAMQAASLELPYLDSQASNGPLLALTNTGNGSGSIAIGGATDSTAGSVAGVIGRVTSTTAGGFSAGVRGINEGTGGNGIGVYGSQNGSGWGVYGFTPDGIGVYGNSSTGTGGFFASSTGTALQVQGPIKVGGSEPAAFVHTATAGTLTCSNNHCTVIDNPATNGNPNAILIVTHRWEGVYDNHVIGVYYTGGKWSIFNEDNATAVPTNSQYNVLVIQR